MSRTKTKPERRSRNGFAAPVLTLVETAAFFRVSEEEILRLVRDQGLPGRPVGDGWRFLKTAIEGWLTCPTDQGQFWQTHFGALGNDPYLTEIVRDAYQKRGRSEDGTP